MSQQLRRDIRAEELQFLVEYTTKKLQREAQAVEELARHVLDVWQACIDSAPVLYRCVQGLRFLSPRVNQHSHYPFVLSTLRQDPHARYLDLGCCFGTDTRRLIVDGWKEENITAVDVTPEFWNYGLKLYQDASFLNIRTLFGDVTSDPELVKSVIANGPLAHVWTGAVLHVLDQAKVEALLRTVFTMLRPGGTYFGTCAGSTDKPKEWLPEYRNRGQAYLHSPKSLKELLEQIGFDEVVVENLDHSLPSEESQHSAPMAFLGFTAKKPA